MNSEEAAASQPMSELVRNFDWSTTPLGPIESWPDSLKIPVRVLLTSRFSMWMAWGPELTALYNDSYARTTLGKKHPWALGRPAREVWPEIWSEIGPLIERVMETGEACWEEAMQLFLERSGYQEETYHTFSYSPLAGPDHKITGMLCVVMEETERVISDRQLAALSALSGALSGAITEQDVYAGIERGLVDQKDMPCTLTYLFDEKGEKLRLVARTGIASDHPAASPLIDAASLEAPWPIHLILDARRAITVDDLASCFPVLPTGCWDKPPARARLVPIARTGQEQPAGVFITALNPYRQLDANYAGFLDLAAGQIAASITSARAYEQERQRAESLAELDRAKTAFFSSMSHELRTPLTLILGPVEDSLTSQSPPSTESLEMLHRNALRLLKLVNGLLDFVRIEAGRMRANYEATDLSLLTVQLASLFRSAVERGGLSLAVDCPPLPEPVFVDREMWEKIVLNLLSNALKSTFEGEIRITLRAHRDEVQLSVADTGTGVSQEDLPHLFERFTRIERARRRSYEGSGIGLALVRELVEMHHGSVRVESTPGEGTQFFVSLPLGTNHLSQGHGAVREAEPVALRGSAAAYVQEALGWLPDPRRLGGEVTGILDDSAGDIDSSVAKPAILIVDDNIDVRDYLQSLLRWRFHLQVAENGRQALEQIARSRPDLVLTDVMMPEMDGIAFIAALRDNPATQGIPVIMLTARAGEESRIEGIDSGADDYLSKPFSARELVARVEAQLKLASLRRRAIEQEQTLHREISRVRQFAWEALEHIPEIFCTLDREFRATYTNATCAEFLSRLGRALLGEVLWDALPEFRNTTVESSARRSMIDRVPVEFEFNFDALAKWYQCRIYPLPDEGISIYARDTTETRQTEEALRRSEQLAVAGRLAASIAHEINNPLEAVTNVLFLARMDESVSGNTKNLLEAADKELQRLSHIAARSLKFYRQHTAPARCMIEELIDAVLFFHEREIGSRKIELERRYRPSPEVLCQPGEIQQVITNLIRNALDALKAHGRLIVAVQPATDRSGRKGVAVTIADNASGMDRAMLRSLFQPFATTKGEAGTGLGLWVSKGILDKHHATIAVRSKKGQGTVFRFFLPRGDEIGTSPPDN
ncbi:MAG TPA: ATP-binding protein [Terracidiphilus sp.]|nr:ATP-binding protein [Terracidiphilus sp.]